MYNEIGKRMEAPWPEPGLRYMNNENMVLRTIYLPPDLDERLRDIAFHAKSSKNELMRCAIETFVAASPEKQRALIEKYKNSKKTEAAAPGIAEQ